MSKSTACRVWIDKKRPGAWNMAADQVLLEQAAREHIATLRLYQWDEPTLSLGYFQPYRHRESHAASRDAAVVRRQSGGGAILHDRELTYCLTLPEVHPLTRVPEEIYIRVHRILVEMLDQLVGEAHRFRLCAQKSGQEPFLCFQRRAIGDIVYLADALAGTPARSPQVDHKVVGSAQRRLRGAVLQHGSILIETSTAAPELCGIEQLASVRLDVHTFAAEFAQRVCDTLNLVPIASTVSADRKWRANNGPHIARLSEVRYGNRTWNERR